MKYGFGEYKKSDILRNHIKMGNKGPEGKEIEVNSLYFEKGGKPFIGVMGEYHFVRDHKENWYKELEKMKAGGITIVATYIFWIYHEEIEGEYDFEGDRDLKAFVKECRRAGLDLVIRIGPWAHGECRNGGFPDWLVNKPFKLRDNNDEYMSYARKWYQRIYKEVEGYFYKEGGPIIGVQIENELVDSPEHLLALKEMAVEIGYDAPLYTVTGWNSLYGAKIPVDDCVPVFAAYVEAPWEQHIEKLPLSWHYIFKPERNDAAVGMDIIGKADDTGWRLPYERYPFATCELGSGLPFSHHRRPVVSGMDAYALSLVKLGCGNNLVGYYMYHGGTNKIGKLSTLQETRATGYPNDYAILNYDFHTCLTQYGEARQQYRLLNLLHLFVRDFGDILAPMEYVGSSIDAGHNPDDLHNLRYSMRTDGKGGFVFVNNYQRLAKMDEFTDVEIDTGSVTFPKISVKDGVSFILPFGIDLFGKKLEYATGQLICKSDNTVFFMAIDGIDLKIKFEGCDEITLEPGSITKMDGLTIAILDVNEASYLRKLSGNIYIGCGVDIYESDENNSNGEAIDAIQKGSYSYKKWNGEAFEAESVNRDFIAPILSKTPVSEPFKPKYEEELMIEGPRDREWYKLEVSDSEGFVEIADQCDVSQIYADGELVADNYYCGEPWRIPAGLIYGKEAYLVLAEMKDDFYREF